MISCVLLAAAGPGQRPDAHLEEIIRDLHGAQLFDISLVAPGSAADAAARSLPVTAVAAEGATDLRNLVAGLDALPRGELSGVLVWPLAAGARSTKFLVTFFHEFYKSRGHIVVPDGPGQMMIIDSSLFDELRHASPHATLQSFLNDHPGELRRIALVER